MPTVGRLFLITSKSFDRLIDIQGVAQRRIPAKMIDGSQNIPARLVKPLPFDNVLTPS
jgi:hypothetical protein